MEKPSRMFLRPADIAILEGVTEGRGGEKLRMIKEGGRVSIREYATYMKVEADEVRESLLL